MHFSITDEGPVLDDDDEGRIEGCAHLVRTDQTFDGHVKLSTPDYAADEIFSEPLSDWTDSMRSIADKVRKDEEKQENPAGPCLCPICGRVCTGPKALTFHINEHEGIEPYECDLCDFKSASKVIPTIHEICSRCSSSWF